MGEYMEKVSEEAAKGWLEEGIAKGETKGRLDTLASLYLKGLLSAEDAAKELNVDVIEFLALVKKKNGE